MDDEQRMLSFRRDIKPLLAGYCTRCHGKQEQESRLDLRALETLFTGGDSGPAIVRGTPEESLLYEMVRDGKMPPKGNRPSATEVDRLQRWITEGTRR